MSTHIKNENFEKYFQLKEDFAIKNYILSDSSQAFANQPLDEPFIFKGFAFIICLQGNAKIKINFRELDLKKGCILIYMPGQIFKLFEKSDDLVLECLFLCSSFVYRLPIRHDLDLLKKMRTNPVLNISEETIHNMLELHALIAKYYQEDENYYRHIQIHSLIFALLMEIASQYSSSTLEVTVAKTRQETLSDEFFKILFENYKNERSVAFYADKLCLTPKYLSTCIKNVTGKPISDWIDAMVIITAKKLLKTTDYTVLQVSEELNFPNPSFFGKFFKQYTGITPLQYKREE